MKKQYKIFHISLLFVSFNISAQSKRILLDTLGNHGLIIRDNDILAIGEERIADTLKKYEIEGWRLTTENEFYDMYKATYSKRQSKILKSVTYITSTFALGKNRVSVYLYGEKPKAVFTQYESMGHKMGVRMLLVKEY